MRLLLDQNLSPRLVSALSDLYPGSVHVSDVGLDRAADRDLWTYAKQQKLVIVTKDADFSEMSVLRGTPPYVVWIRKGNCPTDAIEQLLRTNRETIVEFGKDPQRGVLILY